jgi:DNA-binding transcriptional MerR regulator
MMLRIGTFSRRGRVSVKALRHYEAIGLLKPAHVDSATGYRYYEPTQLDDLHRLMVLRALGLPLERIRGLLRDDPSPELMRHMLAERRATVARRIDAEQAQLAAIEARIRHLEAARLTYDIVVRDVPAALVASLRRVVPDYGAVESLFDEIAKALPKTARVAGHGAVWHHCAPHRQQIDCEAVVLLERPISAPRSLKFYQLPACRAACIVHPSDEEEAFAAAQAALADQPFKFEGPMRERYFSSVGDSRFDLTEIQFPLCPSTGAIA